MLKVQRIRIYPELIPGVCAVRSLCRCSHLNSNSFVCVFAVCASLSYCLFCWLQVHERMSELFQLLIEERKAQVLLALRAFDFP